MNLQLNEKRYKRQQIGQQRWKLAEELGIGSRAGWGVWWWETGIGKTFATVDMIKKMVSFNSAWTFYVVIPTGIDSLIYKQWQETINSILPVEFHNNISVLTIHKVSDDYKNGITRDCTVLILDEIHEYYGEERIKIFFGEYIRSKWCLGLTANYEDKDNRYRLIQSILPVVDRIDDDEAVREGYISKYIEFNLGIYLTESERKEYDELTKKVTQNLSKLGNNGLQIANKIVSELGKKDYSTIFSIANQNGWNQNKNPEDIWAPKNIIGYAVNSLNSVRERKNLIYTCVGKLKAALEVIRKFDQLKTICFSQSTLYADTLSNQINTYYQETNPQLGKVCVVYHSKLNTIIYEDPITGKSKKKGKTVLKREAIEAISSGKSRVLSTASSLDRGADIPGIECSVTTSGTQNPIQHNQRGGRSKRKKEEENSVALIVNIYARGTVDERWLNKRQSKSTNTVYYVDNVDDIHYSPKSKETFNLNEI